MSGPNVEIPRYRCHKEVRAAKITGFRQNGQPDMPDILLGEIGGIVTMLPDWRAKHKPQIGGYFVEYEDGYKSFNHLHRAFWSECPAPASAAPLRPLPDTAEA